MEPKVINSSVAEISKEGEMKLVEGERLAMRLWREFPRGDKEMVSRGYETLGYVLKGRALLTLGSSTVELREGDSWCVPSGGEHKYMIQSDFEAVEVHTS